MLCRSAARGRLKLVCGLLLSEETAEGTPLSICVAHKALQPWHPSSAWQLCQLQLIFVRPQLLQDITIIRLSRTCSSCGRTA